MKFRLPEYDKDQVINQYIKDPTGHLLTIVKQYMCLVEEDGDGKKKIRVKRGDGEVMIRSSML
jgi:hypothetical protein